MSCGNCTYWQAHRIKHVDGEQYGLCKHYEANVDGLPAAYRALMAQRSMTREKDCWDCPTFAPKSA